MTAWFNDLPLDFGRSETREAARLLVIAYNTAPQALELAQTAGIDITTIKHDQTVRELIQDIMEAARLADRLPRLLKEAMDDPRCVAIQGDLLRLLEPPQPALDPGDGVTGGSSTNGDKRDGHRPKSLALGGGGLVTVAAIAGLALWLWPVAPLEISFRTGASPRLDVMPGQPLTADLSSVVTRGDEAIEHLRTTYEIKSPSESCAMDGGLGSWGIKIEGNSLIATAPFRLQNLLQPCEVTIEASVTEGDEKATAVQTYVFAPAERNLLQVGAGTNFACALKTSGDVLCWGGEVNPYTDLSPPPGLKADAIAAGTNSVCAFLRGAEGVRCWGGPDAQSNEARQTDRASIGPVAGISAGALVFCENFSDSTLNCWTGEGETTTKLRIEHLEGVRTGRAHRACGMTNDDLVCADFGPAAQAGNTVNGAAPRFWRAPRLKDKKIIDFADPADDHVCVLLDDRKINCFIFSAGSVVDVTKAFPGNSNVQSIIDNGQFLCALADSGAISCPEINGLNPKPTLTEKIEGFKAVSIAAADDHGLCAILADDKIKCWSTGDSERRPAVFTAEIPEEIAAESSAEYQTLCSGELSVEKKAATHMTTDPDPVTCNMRPGSRVHVRFSDVLVWPYRQQFRVYLAFSEAGSHEYGHINPGAGYDFYDEYPGFAVDRIVPADGKMIANVMWGECGTNEPPCRADAYATIRRSTDVKR